MLAIEAELTSLIDTASIHEVWRSIIVLADIKEELRQYQYHLESAKIWPFSKRRFCVPGYFGGLAAQALEYPLSNLLLHILIWCKDFFKSIAKKRFCEAAFSRMSGIIDRGFLSDFVT